MKDTPPPAVPELAQDALQESAMDQALDWLITLECADASEKAAFQAWLKADPAHAQAFAKAHAVCPYSNAVKGNIDVAISVSVN